MACAATLVGCLAALAAASAAQAAFPGTNGKIAYDSFMSTDFEIVTINPNGTDAAPLTVNAEDDFEPSWSPNGQRIVFQRVDPSSQKGEIWVMNADGSGQTQLTDDVTDGSFDASPAFSGDGSRIVFSRFTGSTRHIWVMNANGTGQTQLTNATNFDFEPTFSPDSTKIAFVREVDAPMTSPETIWVMNADGSGPTNVTPIDGTMDAEGPNFSPDGSQLTFSRCDITGEGCPTNVEIVRMPSGGGAITEVTSNGGGDSEPTDIDPVFSPDSAQVAFNRQAYLTSVSDILSVAAGGGAGTPVTTTGDERNPDWQPVAVPPAGGTGSGGALGALAGSGGRCFGEDITIFGTNGDDKIVGTPGPDVVRGFRGDDKINGKGDGDILCGGRGDDRIFGKGGPDILIGGDDSDFLNGGSGINRLFGGTPGAPEEKATNICVLRPNDTQQNCQVVK